MPDIQPLPQMLCSPPMPKAKTARSTRNDKDTNPLTSPAHMSSILDII